MFLDFLGTILSLVATYFFIQSNRHAWSISIFATLVNSRLYFTEGIYADMCLELFYLTTSCYGWVYWSKHNKKTTPLFEAKSLNWQLATSITLATGMLFIGIYGLLTQFTHSNVPSMDALTTSLSLSAQWLMCRKNIATWILWFLADSLYIALYWHKELPFHTALMLIYTGMAIAGYIKWSNNNRALALS